jgi:hypothetical protein
MDKLLFSRQRRFKVWHYWISHSQLLLRSEKDARHPTRVEVLFKPVASMNLPTTMDELHIAEADDATAAGIWEQVGGPHYPDDKVFVLWGPGFRGHIVALSIHFAEDEGDSSTPSPLFGPMLPELWEEFLAHRKAVVANEGLFGHLSPGRSAAGPQQ